MNLHPFTVQIRLVVSLSIGTLNRIYVDSYPLPFVGSTCTFNFGIFKNIIL